MNQVRIVVQGAAVRSQEIFGARLLAFRKACGLSERSLGKILCVSKATARRMTAGETGSFGEDEANRLADWTAQEYDDKPGRVALARGIARTDILDHEWFRDLVREFRPIGNSSAVRELRADVALECDDVRSVVVLIVERVRQIMETVREAKAALDLVPEDQQNLEWGNNLVGLEKLESLLLTPAFRRTFKR